jgi:hypothetical protein
MTMDHIIARSLGGLDELLNTQTMCCWHNWMKGTREGSIANKRRRDLQIESAPLRVTYVGQKGEPKVRAIATTVRKTFNFFLNDPMTWDTEKFLDIIWKHAGFQCIEVRLVDNNYRNAEGKLAHRYDLFFVTGKGLLQEGKVNALMRKIEADIRTNLDIEMPDTHFVIDDNPLGMGLELDKDSKLCLVTCGNFSSALNTDSLSNAGI